MLKNLLEFNSKENIWLRDNATKVRVIGCGIGAIVLITTVVYTIKESRK